MGYTKKNIYRTKQYRTKKYRSKKYRSKQYRTKKYRTKQYRTKKYRTKQYRTKQYGGDDKLLPLIGKTNPKTADVVAISVMEIMNGLTDNLNIVIEYINKKYKQPNSGLFPENIKKYIDAINEFNENKLKIIEILATTSLGDDAKNILELSINKIIKPVFDENKKQIEELLATNAERLTTSALQSLLIFPPFAAANVVAKLVITGISTKDTIAGVGCSAKKKKNEMAQVAEDAMKLYAGIMERLKSTKIEKNI